MPDNPEAPVVDNPVTQDTPAAPPMKPESPEFMWKSQLSKDLMNSPTMQKFEDTPEGLGKAVESHLSLEKMLGHDKVPIPKGPDDKEGWNIFSKALGIPDKAEEYGLADADIPESMKDMTMDKNRFSEIVHAHKLTPAQAKGLWEAYQDVNKETYKQAMADQENTMTETINRMRGEWGDAYEGNVELGQMVINKFSSEKGMEDFITSTLMKHPMGIKFLAKIGNQFAEAKVGDFGYKRFSLTPEQTQAEIDSIANDPNHPYNNDKADGPSRERAITYVNSLYSSLLKAKGQPEGP